MNDHIKHLLDGLSIGGTLAAFIGVVPAITALATLVWTLLRIYETATVQRLLKRTKEMKDGR